MHTMVCILQEVQFVDVDDKAISALNEEFAQQNEVLSPSSVDTIQDDSSGIQGMQHVSAQSHLSCLLCCTLKLFATP